MQTCSKKFVFGVCMNFVGKSNYQCDGTLLNKKWNKIETGQSLKFALCDTLCISPTQDHAVWSKLCKPPFFPYLIPYNDICVHIPNCNFSCKIKICVKLGDALIPQKVS